MKIGAVYLAGRYARREELLGYAGQLAKVGITVNSTWLLGNHEFAEPVGGIPGNLEQAGGFAKEDLEDVMAAPIFIAFTEPSGGGPARGGRHVEFGFAFAFGSTCIVVGHRENIFHCLPEVLFFETWGECFAWLKECKSARRRR